MKAKVSVFLTDYPRTASSFTFDFNMEDVESWAGKHPTALQDALSDWAHEEIGKRQIWSFDVEVIDE